MQWPCGCGLTLTKQSVPSLPIFQNSEQIMESFSSTCSICKAESGPVHSSYCVAHSSHYHDKSLHRHSASGMRVLGKCFEDIGSLGLVTLPVIPKEDKMCVWKSEVGKFQRSGNFTHLLGDPLSYCGGVAHCAVFSSHCPECPVLWADDCKHQELAGTGQGGLAG